MLYICTTVVGKYSFSIQKNKFREGVVRVKTWFVNKPGFITWQILKNETHVCFVIFYCSRAYMGLFYVTKNAGKNFFSRAGDNESPGYGK